MNRLAVIVSALLWAHAVCFAPSRGPGSLVHRASSRSRVGVPRVPISLLQVEQSTCNNDRAVNDKNGRGLLRRLKVEDTRRTRIIGAALIFAAIGIFPSPASAASIMSCIPSPSDLRASLTSILDNLSHSGVKGMVIYTLSFIIWTMTIGATTPVETAAGMAFPLQKSIPLSAIGKISGAFFQYALAKYLFSDYARKKLENNEWMNKISASFKSHPYRVALIWRFSPLPEFVKNIGPALVPTLRTRYQILAILTHGLPFTVLWSCMGSEAARVARGGHPSGLFKRMVAGIFWVGFVVSPTLFGKWIAGLSSGDEASTEGSGGDGI